MSLPEWGYSYNALYVPLTSDWQCSLVPVRYLEDADRGWKLSYQERQKARKEREERIEQDRKDFDRLFRVPVSQCEARACSEFSAYTAFIRDHLRISGISAPIDGDDVTRILREAVRKGRLIPAIDRTWRGSRRVSQRHAPQSWPKQTPAPKPTVYGVRDNRFVPLDDSGYFIDRMPYAPVATAAASSTGSSGSSGVAWLAAAEDAVGALPGSDDDWDDAGNDTPDVAESLTGGEGSDVSDDITPLGDAPPFEYQADIPGGDGEQVAARGVRMTGNEPGGFAINPNGLDVDYFDSDGNLSAQYHGSHGDPHGHNVTDGERDNAHIPMSPINFD